MTDLLLRLNGRPLTACYIKYYAHLYFTQIITVTICQYVSAAPSHKTNEVFQSWQCKGVWERHQGRISWPGSQHYSG